MFGIGGTEIAIILIFGFLIFGPDKLPQIARTVGRALRQFRTAQDQMNKVIKAEVYDPLKDLEPLVNPFAGLSLDDKKAAEKKDADAKKGTKSAADKSKPSPATDEAEEPKPKISSDAMQAAVAADTAKTRAAASAASKTTAKQTAAAGGAESFAQRRARLEKEHARAKATQAGEQPAAKEAVAAPAVAAKAQPAAQTATKPAGAAKKESAAKNSTSKKGKEAEQDA